MQKTIAIALMDSLIALGRPLNDVVLKIGEIDDDEQKRAFRHAIAAIMGDVYTELMIPILREYPELDLDAGKTGST